MNQNPDDLKLTVADQGDDYEARYSLSESVVEVEVYWGCVVRRHERVYETMTNFHSEVGVAPQQ